MDEQKQLDEAVAFAEEAIAAVGDTFKQVKIDTTHLADVLASRRAWKARAEKAEADRTHMAEAVAAIADRSDEMRPLFRMANILAPVFDAIADGRAQNHATTTVSIVHPDGAVTTWSFTAQREGGTTPCDRIAALEDVLAAKSAECARLRNQLEHVVREFDDAVASLTDAHPSAEACPVDECGVCAMRDCPRHEVLHYHHDGCPACSELPQTLPVPSSDAYL